MRPSGNVWADERNGSENVSLRCPACRKEGVFFAIWKSVDVAWPHMQSTETGEFSYTHHGGMRQCPNEECGELVFVVRSGSRALQVFPPEAIAIERAHLPPAIFSSLREAVACHAAGCYRAAALMVRRVLEELCDDKQAKGKDLKVRIAALGDLAVLPRELLEAADELRLLGNDAAHIVAKTYDAIEAEEVEVAIDLTKELLKAVYQYGSLVDRLRALKKPSL